MLCLKLLVDGKVTNDRNRNNKKLKQHSTKKLYTSTKPNLNDMQEYMNTTTVERKLNREQSKLCDGLMTLQECTDYINSMKDNKSPGLDGISVEVDKTYWSSIGPMIVDSLNEGYTRGQLSSTKKQGLILLLYKEGEPELIENWRPITLVNIDYKILTRVLAKTNANNSS